MFPDQQNLLRLTAASGISKTQKDSHSITEEPRNRFGLCHVLMWMDGQVPTELGPTERAILKSLDGLHPQPWEQIMFPKLSVLFS
jgi:hypothetical protein